MSYHVNGLNTGIGAQHLGHYSGIVLASESIPKKEKVVILLDDLLAFEMFPSQRSKINNRTLFIASEYERLDLLTDRFILVRASRLPSLMAWIILASCKISAAQLDRTYSHTYLGKVSPSIRRDANLSQVPSGFERLYPILAIPALTLGLKADSIFGSSEMDGYFGITCDIWERFHSQKSAPMLLDPRPINVLGADGRYMSVHNALYWSLPLDQAKNKIEAIASRDSCLLEQYATLLRRPGEAGTVAVDSEQLAVEWEKTFSSLHSKQVNITAVEGILRHNEANIEAELRSSFTAALGS